MLGSLSYKRIKRKKTNLIKDLKYAYVQNIKKFNFERKRILNLLLKRGLGSKILLRSLKGDDLKNNKLLSNNLYYMKIKKKYVVVSNSLLWRVLKCYRNSSKNWTRFVKILKKRKKLCGLVIDLCI